MKRLIIRISALVGMLAIGYIAIAQAQAVMTNLH